MQQRVFRKTCNQVRVSHNHGAALSSQQQLLAVLKRSPRRRQKTKLTSGAFGSLLWCSFCWRGTRARSHLTVLTAAEADVMEAELCKCSRKEGALCVLMDLVCIQPCRKLTVWLVQAEDISQNSATILRINCLGQGHSRISIYFLIPPSTAVNQ